MLWSAPKWCIIPEGICGWSIKPVLTEEQCVLSRCRKALMCLWFSNSAPVFQLLPLIQPTASMPQATASTLALQSWSFQWDTSSSHSTQKVPPLALFIARRNGASASSCPAFTVVPSSQKGSGGWRRIRSAKQSVVIPPAAQLGGIYLLPEARLRKGHLQETRSLTAGPGSQLNTKCKEMSLVALWTFLSNLVPSNTLLWVVLSWINLRPSSPS